MRAWLVCGAVNGFLAVACGAFAAHGLRKVLSPEMVATFETGARYQMFHALALLAVGLLAQTRPSPLLNGAGWAFTAGTILFSGSLYALPLTGLRWLGMITPFGGLAFLAGWLLLALAAWRTT